MQTSVIMVIEGATAAELFAQVETLDRYPAWMRMVHDVVPLEPDEGRPTWQVELRARVGPFARSKRLRMVRTVFEPGRRVRFSRVQDDERDHADWILTATVADAPDAIPAGAADGAAEGAQLTMDLEYTGEMWSGGVLTRILDEEIRRGKGALRRAVSSSPRR